MKRFAYIENDQVKQVGGLPTNWNNISNFYLLDPENQYDLSIIRQNGWLPVETFSENKEVVVKTEFLVEGNIVKEIITTRDKTEQELQVEHQFAIEAKWNSIRNQRNILLRDSDVEVVSDKWEQMSLEDKTKIANYRQALRDLPQDFTNPDEVIWPIKP